MKRLFLRFLTILFAALFLCLPLLGLPVRANDNVMIRYCIANCAFYLRSGPSEGSDRGIRISTNQVLPVLEITSNGWYKVKYESRAQAMVHTGYVSPSWADLCPEFAGECEESFENTLSDFPESYKPYLRALHRAKPNWKFVAGVSGISFPEWVEVQSAARMGASEPTSNSFVYSSYSALYRHADYADKLVDGNTMYCANSGTVAYFMDPRNFLNEVDVYMFYQFDGGTRSVEDLEAVLQGSYLLSYAQDFHDVGEANGIDPYYLIVQAISENGANGTPLSRGESRTVCENAGCTDESHSQKSYYNFFGVGSTPGGSPQHNGLLYAIEHEWDTPYKALLGGSELLNRGYVKQGQNTPYYKKFNVGAGKDTATAWHQWMQNLAHPETEAGLLRKQFAESGIPDQNYTFLIPVFPNMPESACALPLSPGSAPMPVLTETAGSGTDEGHVSFTTTYQTDFPNALLYGASAGTSAASVYEHFTLGEGTTISLSSSVAATGSVLTFYYKGSWAGAYTLVCRGDPSGDGKISAADLLHIRKQLLGLIAPSAAQSAASDINNDSKVSAADLLYVRKHLLGLYSITD